MFAIVNKATINMRAQIWSSPCRKMDGLSEVIESQEEKTCNLSLYAESRYYNYMCRKMNTLI